MIASVMIDEKVLTWMLKNGDPWVRYRIMHDFMGEERTKLDQEKRRILEDKRIKKLIKKIKETDWKNPLWTYLKDAKLPVHALTVLTEFGVRVDDLPIFYEISDKILNLSTEEGEIRFAPYIEHPLTCLSSTLLFPIVKSGLKNDEKVKKTINIYLNTHNFQNGWKCLTQNFSGNIFYKDVTQRDYTLKRKESFLKSMSKKNLMCPLTTLNILRILAEYPEYHNHNYTISAIDGVLKLWEERKAGNRPYGFGMGTQFQKLKYPFIWYEILKTVYILSHFNHAWEDTRFNDMLQVIIGKKDKHGRYSPESIFIAWKDFDFCDKRQPSPWITYLVYYILSKNPNEKCLTKKKRRE